jgi:hypothetical protein
LYGHGRRIFKGGRVIGERSRRMLKMAVQQGRNERRGDAYSVPYVEPLSEARTKLAVFFSILLEMWSFFRPAAKRPESFKKPRG